MHRRRYSAGRRTTTAGCCRSTATDRKSKPGIATTKRKPGSGIKTTKLEPGTGPAATEHEPEPGIATTERKPEPGESAVHLLRQFRRMPRL